MFHFPKEYKVLRVYGSVIRIIRESHDQLLICFLGLFGREGDMTTRMGSSSDIMGKQYQYLNYISRSRIWTRTPALNKRRFARDNDTKFVRARLKSQMLVRIIIKHFKKICNFIWFRVKCFI